MNTSVETTALRYPAIWRRFGAMIYDALLLLALSMAYGGVALAISRFLLSNEEKFVSGTLFQVGWLVVLLGFFCYFWMRAGQTLGMRAWRLQIIRAGTHNTRAMPSLPQCIGRCLLAPLGLLLCITGLFRADRQCLHDLWTGTQLILLDKPKK